MSRVALLFGLANETRLEILDLLHKEGEMSVGDVADKLSLPQAGTSRHLIILRDAGAVSVERVHSRKIYRVSAAIAGLVQVATNLVAA